MPIQLDIRQVTFALSSAIDLVGVDSIQHGKRVAYMADVCGEASGLGDEDRIDLFHAALLHDCGVSSTSTHMHLVSELEWSEAQDHCLKGAELLACFNPLSHLAETIRWHHTRWADIPAEVAGCRDGRFANLIYLVDRVDALLAQQPEQDVLLNKDAVRGRIRALGGSLFDPRWVAVFDHCAESDAFWLTLSPEHLARYLYDREKETQPRSIDLDELKHLARVFSLVVDAKSRFTHEHSEGVAGLAAHLGRLWGLSGERCDMLEVAGLLHDLGKLRVPDEILEKQGPLDGSEQATMHHHAFDTYQILHRIEGLGEIAEWAAYHHENIEGDGYPFNRRGAEIVLEARILAVADVFQALAQDRPYRKAMPLQRIGELMSAFAGQGKLDRRVVGIVLANLTSCWEHALPSRGPAKPARGAES